MIQPVINPISEKTLLALVKNMPQSLLITGKPGVGLGTISKYFASMRKATVSVILPEKDEKIDLEKGTISVEIIRRVYDETRTKTAGERIIIIDFAERMTIQAQNAFLKLLEEPGIGIYFILASHSIEKILPTILSRTEKLEILPITASQSEEFLDKLNVSDKIKRSQLMFIAEGLPAELSRLVNDEKYFISRSELIRDAKEILVGTPYKKLLIAHKYKDNRSDSLILLLSMAKILKRSIVDNPKPETIAKIDDILDAYSQIEANGNIRLCLARMIL